MATSGNVTDEVWKESKAVMISVCCKSPLDEMTGFQP